MAQRTTVFIFCDLPHGEDMTAEETVTFGYDGTAYEIDVCAPHARELKGTFIPYAEAARKATGRQQYVPASSNGHGPPRRARTSAHREHTAAVRAWAAGKVAAGDARYKIADRGRIPGWVVDAYKNET